MTQMNLLSTAYFLIPFVAELLVSCHHIFIAHNIFWGQNQCIRRQQVVKLKLFPNREKLESTKLDTSVLLASKNKRDILFNTTYALTSHIKWTSLLVVGF